MTNRKKIEERFDKLIEAKEDLQNYFKNTIIPQLFVDADLILRKFTPSAIKQFDLSEKDKGKHLKEITNNTIFSDIITIIEEVIENNEGIEKEIQTTDGRWFQMNILPYIEMKKKITNGAIVTFIDITDRVEILKGYEKQKLNYENIIYSLSHDLKGPLNNIESLVNLIGKVPKAKDQNIKSYQEMLLKAVKNLRKTIEGATDINKKNKEKEKIELAKLIDEVKLALTDKIFETKANIKNELDVQQINFSKKDLRSILYNLLSNSLKYCFQDRSPKVLIKTSEKDQYNLLSVTDNGIGINEKMKGKIFSRSVRLNNEVEGSGIGLYIVKRIVDESGGKIEVESKEGIGSTFHIYLLK